MKIALLSQFSPGSEIRTNHFQFLNLAGNPDFCQKASFITSTTGIKMSTDLSFDVFLLRSFLSFPFWLLQQQQQWQKKNNCKLSSPSSSSSLSFKRRNVTRRWLKSSNDPSRRRKWRLASVTSKKLPNVYKRCPKNDFTRKIKDFDTFT